MSVSQELVQQALVLARKYNPTEEELWLSPSSTKHNALVPSKADQYHLQRTRSLEKKLAISKQRVVKHLLISRSLEKSILQGEIIQNAVKTHLQTRVSLADRPKRTLDQGATGGGQGSGDELSLWREKNHWLDSHSLSTIECGACLDFGTAQVVQEALNHYRDDALRSELESFPESALSHVDASFFLKIVKACSNGRVTHVDASFLFQRATQVVPQKSADEDEKWELLTSLLRKKMLLIHLANSVLYAHRIGDGISGAYASSSSRLLADGHPLDAGNSTISHLSLGEQTWASSGSNSNSQGSHMHKGEKQQLVNIMHHHLMLKQSLRDSQSRQHNLSESIVTNLSLISQSVSIKDLSEHRAALIFARKVSLQKLVKTLATVALRALREGWRRWLLDLKGHRAMIASQKCLKLLSAYRMFNTFETSLNSKQARAFRKIKETMNWFASMEGLCAIIELQRYWRGCLSRKRSHNALKNYCATLIQKMARARIARRRVYFIRQHGHLKAMVLRIERAYMNFRARRLRREIRAFRRQRKLAINIQRVFRGHRGRKRAKEVRARFNRIRGAIKMQSLWKRYKATLRVDAMMLQRQRIRAAVKFQSLVRGMLARIHVASIFERFYRARTIQCCFRCRKARREHKRRYYLKCVREIQRVARGRNGRKRFAWFKKQRETLLKRKNEALRLLTPVLKGHSVRKRWLPLIRRHISRRRNCVIKLQCMVRIHFAKKRVDFIRREKAARLERIRLAKLAAEEMRKNQYMAAGAIQRIARGCIGRRKALTKKLYVQKQEALRQASMPAYYRLREDYYKSQNMFHRPYLITMQCAMRSARARFRVKNQRRLVSARKIQRAWRKHRDRKVAKKIVDNLRELRRRKNFGATQFQRIIRGFMGRYEVKKHEKAEINKWFLHEIKQLGLIGRALQNFRVRKRTLEKIERSAIRMQALVRRFLTRCKFLRGYKRLVRERENRRKKRRIRACTLIQGFARIIKAQKVVAKRKALVAEEMRLAREMDQLDDRLDGMHGDWMNDLLAIRAQSGVRGMLGKAAFSKKATDTKAEAAKNEANRKHWAATRIQAMARGVQSRIKLKKMLPVLRRERQARSFCVECEANVAVKRCRQCKDRYCDACYQKIHRRGMRRGHSWEPITTDTRIPTMGPDGSLPAERGNKKKKKGSQEVTVAPSVPAVKAPASKKDWEKFYDNAAKANYWFNQKTGEASWVDPTVDLK